MGETGAGRDNEAVPPASDTPWRILLLSVLVFLLLTKMHLPGSYNEFRVFPLEDDAYYYTKIATQFWHHGYPTFEGITHTNGYQPLWMLVAIASAFPFVALGLEVWMPFVLGIVNAVFILLAAHLLFSIMRREGIGAQRTLLCCAIALGLPLYSYLFNLMETSSTLLCVLLLALYLQNRFQRRIPIRPLMLAVLSFGVLMSRLDMGVFLLLLYAALLLWVPMWRLLIAGLLLCAFTLPYFVYNYALNGSITPISGMVKSRWSDLSELASDGKLARTPGDYWRSNATWQRRVLDMRNGIAEPVGHLLEYATFGKWLGPSSTPAPFSAPYLLSVLFGVCAVIAGFKIKLFRDWRSLPESRQMLGMFLLLVIAFYFFQLVYYPFFSHILYTWYLGLGLVALLLCMVFGASAFLDRATDATKRICVLLVVIALLSMDVAAWQRERTFNRNLYLTQNGFATAAKWLQDNTRPETRIASWTAGQLGQMSERRVVNMEGLVADIGVLDTYDDMNSAKYMLKHRIKFVCNHFPDFEGGLDPRLAHRPDWVALETWEPSLSLLWDTFIWPSPTRGPAYTRWGDNAFWAHRYRPLLDYPEVFTVVFKERVQTSSIYIFELDSHALQSSLDRHAELMNLSSFGVQSFEAEHGVQGDEVHISAHAPRSNAFVVTGRNLRWEYTVSQEEPFYIVALLRSAAQEMHGAYLGAAGQQAPVAHGGNVRTAWSMLKINDSPIVPDQGKLSIESNDIMGRFDPETRLESAAYLDQFLMVPASSLEHFEKRAQVITRWMNRSPRVPHDPEPAPPRIPTTF